MKIATLYVGAYIFSAAVGAIGAGALTLHAACKVEDQFSYRFHREELHQQNLQIGEPALELLGKSLTGSLLLMLGMYLEKKT